jgi:hypothetical protein
VTNEQLLIVLVAAAVYVGWAILLVLPLPVIQPVRDPVVVRHGWLARVLGIGGALIPAALVVLGFVADATEEAAYAILVFVVFVALLHTILLLEIVRVRLVVSDVGVQLDSPWGRQRFLHWDEIVDVQYSQSGHWFVLYGKNGRKIRASTYIAGIVVLVRAFRTHLPKVVYENAYIGIEMVDHGEPEPLSRRGPGSA